MQRAVCSWVFALGAAVSTLAYAPVASACGGCFHGMDMRSTQVTGHRMIFSVSPMSTTLWDQITYVGAPEEFAWVLPTKGLVDVGLSADGMFVGLEAFTAI